MIEIQDLGEYPESVSLAVLVNTFRKQGFPDLAKYAVVWPEEENEVLGFNAPHTLLCAKPPSDQHAAQIWGSLWKKLTGSDQPDNWATVESPAVWEQADREIRQIRSWLGHLKKRHSGPSPAWMRIFDHQSESVPIEYGVDERTWSIYWSPTDQPVPVELPTAETGNYVPPEGTPQVPEEELQIPELHELQDESGHTRFEMVEFEAPGRERQIRAIWKEHLDHLQQRGLILGYGSDKEDLFIRMPDGVRVGTLKRTRILDRSVMMVRKCSPMRQDPVPVSSTRAGSTRYPRSSATFGIPRARAD